MRISCTHLQAAFSGAKVSLTGRPPLSLTLDCHDRPPFILRVAPVAEAPLPGTGASDLIKAEVSLHPARSLLADLEAFAASHKVPLAPVADLPPMVRENLVLAACHLADSKFFIFSEKAVLTARLVGPLAVELTVTGPFRAQRLPCQESDVILHLDAPAAARLLSWLTSLARAAA
jgi:hypothetical protein